MPINIPHIMEPFQGTDEQWSAYYELQIAGIEYAIAYGDTIGLFSIFSISKNKLLKQARDNYHTKRKEYFKIMVNNND